MESTPYGGIAGRRTREYHRRNCVISMSFPRSLLWRNRKGSFPDRRYGLPGAYQMIIRSPLRSKGMFALLKCQTQAGGEQT